MGERRVEEIARDVFECATAWTPNACIVGNVTAAEMARLAQAVIAGERSRTEKPIDPETEMCFRCRDFAACTVYGHGGSGRMDAGEAPARDVKCPRCYGHGETAWDDTRMVRCGACAGTGKAREGG